MNGGPQSRESTFSGAAVTTKIEIVRQLGEQALLLPSLLSDALTANDRLKLRLTVLQEAAIHAQEPNKAPFFFGSSEPIAMTLALRVTRRIPSHHCSRPGGLPVLGEPASPRVSPTQWP